MELELEDPLIFPFVSLCCGRLGEGEGAAAAGSLTNIPVLGRELE